MKKMIQNIINKFKKEVYYNMEITGVENMTEQHLVSVMTQLQDMGYKPHLKGRGDGQVSIKIPEEEEDANEKTLQ